MDWTVSSYPKDTIYTHQWTIKDFSEALNRNNDKIDSPTFKMPGLQWPFFLRITRSQCHRDFVASFGSSRVWDDHTWNGYTKNEESIVDGVKHFITDLFDVWLLAKKTSDDLRKLKLAGTLELSQGTTDVISKGHFLRTLEGEGLMGAWYALSSGSSFASIHSDGWQFVKEDSDSRYGTREKLLLGPGELPCADFFALDHTTELTLKAIIKIPSSMVHNSGVVSGADEEKVPFKHLLDQPDFSDVTLKVGNREFRCHRVILANKSPVFRRMLTTDMMEARTGVVEIVDIEADTMEKLLEFVYSGEVLDMGDQLFLLFDAADKYEVMGLFNICINVFGKEDVTPSNAVAILL